MINIIFVKFTLTPRAAAYFYFLSRLLRKIEQTFEITT